ncbi:MAG: hypothetical protein HN576_15635 [Bacteriovoracaceae bacterium]|mgnify:CR=1 FL=1|jgi:hypothetical protein|nr:hypothetical protein [Bacteriovoracaceae bacterium]
MIHILILFFLLLTCGKVNKDVDVSTTELGSIFIQLGATTNAGEDYCNGVAADGSGNIYSAGFTTGGMSEGNGGGNDIIIMRLKSDDGLDP